MSSDSKDNFDLLNTFAHDLKAPLGGVRNFAQMVEQSGELNAQQQKWLERIYKSVDRMLMLINDMLSSAKIDASEMLKMESVDLHLVIRYALDMMESLITTKHLIVDLNIADDAQFVTGDEGWLNHALLNIISNAVKYNKDGGTVRISTLLDIDTIRIEVTDTGVGIPPEAMPKIFTKFFRAKTVKSTEGTGLGLAIAKSVIEQHGGDITVTSEMGIGTTFTIVLPNIKSDMAYMIQAVADVESREGSEEIDGVDDSMQEGVDPSDSDSHRDTH